MKNVLHRLISVCSILLITTAGVLAQDTASVQWPLTVTSTTGAVTSGQVSGESEFLKNTEINQYTGFNSSQRIRMVGNAWPLSQTTPIDTVYIQFTARPKAGITFTVTSLKMYLAGNGGANMRAKVFYSTDSTFSVRTEIYAGTANLPNNTAFDSAIAVLNAEIPEGKGFYLRVYPWLNNQTGSNTGKYLLLQNIIIAGTTTGSAVVNLPTVTTSAVTNISTTFAVSGGNISNDGGGAVTARGICWDTMTVPTTEKNKTIDGTGSGSFSSVVSGLLPGKTYFLRAYATNSAGTAYGAEGTLTTLLTTTIPTVTTTAASNILATTASSGGNVTFWGGDTITSRGICWSTAPNPTTSNNVTVSGNGAGSFSSTLYNLSPSTTYYLRAYAVNSLGTGYGNEISFSTQSLAPDVMKIVAKDGSGDHTTVQSAFDAVPASYTGKYYIFVKKGTYKEKLLLSQNKVNVILVGEERDSTVLTYDDYAGKSGGTSTSYSVAIDADDFTAMNITFRNTVKNDGSFADQQAVALRVNGDRQAYYNCNLLGYQDTYYTWGGRGTQRTYHKNCLIEGSVDFIFGRNIVLFDSCEIRVNRNNGTLTAAATEPVAKFGYVFINSKISSYAAGFDGNPITTFALGRPWQSSPRTVFLNCEQPANLNPAGWLAWNVAPGLYAEYRCFGPGAGTSHRVSWSSQLSDSTAALYTMQNIFSKHSVTPAFGSDWLPVKPAMTFPTAVKKRSGGDIPKEYSLTQNYPNPFNPGTRIEFTVKNREFTTVTVFTVLGQSIAQLFGGMAEPGMVYGVNFDAAAFPSGVYFYTIETERFRSTRKMILQK